MTGSIERRCPCCDEPMAALGRSGTDCKDLLDGELAAAGFLLINLPGGCTIEDA